MGDDVSILGHGTSSTSYCVHCIHIIVSVSGSPQQPRVFVHPKCSVSRKALQEVGGRVRDVRETLDLPSSGVLPINWDGNVRKKYTTVTCVVLKSEARRQT
ncbi:hypothetical protein TNCV_3933491 [Trichonephila clavipes]|nr:hypothetical protein TNCV_3933491 [Trichonephila clavipes]